MTRRTYGDVKTELARLASQAGLTTGDARLLSYTNLAIETLIPRLELYPSLDHRMVFRQYDGLLALPSTYERLLYLDLGRHHHAPVVNQWYEFSSSGPGQQDWCPWARAAIDRGVQPVFHQALGNPMKLRLMSYGDERVNGVRPTVLVKGYDDARQWVRSQVNGVWQDGVVLPLNGDLATPTADTSNLWAEVTEVQLPVRNQTAELYWIDNGNSSTLYLAGRYEPWETSAGFRCYYVPHLDRCPGETIHLIARRKYRPVAVDTDELLIPSLPALRLAMRALAKEDADDLNGANGYWASALAQLKAEAKQHFGNLQPVAQTLPGPGSFGATDNVL